MNGTSTRTGTPRSTTRTSGNAARFGVGLVLVGGLLAGAVAPAVAAPATGTSTLAASHAAHTTAHRTAHRSAVRVGAGVAFVRTRDGRVTQVR